MKVKQERIRKYLEEYIAQIENTGNSKGGSEHLSFKTAKLDSFRVEEAGEHSLRVYFNYRLYIETEFTCEPDNPPYEYYKQGEVLVNLKELMD